MGCQGEENLVNDKAAITEEKARQILAEMHSQAADPDVFSARRAEEGWVFAWSDRSKAAPIGVRSTVVTDTGNVGKLKIGETAEQALRRLSE